MQYFNAGVQQDAAAGAALTLSTVFTHSRGLGSQRALGLTAEQVDDLTDLRRERSLRSEFRGDIAAERTRSHVLEVPSGPCRFGRKDGSILSGLAIDNNDPLLRRDQGLEFLDVSSQVSVEKISSKLRKRGRSMRYGSLIPVRRWWIHISLL